MGRRCQRRRQAVVLLRRAGGEVLLVRRGPPPTPWHFPSTEPGVEDPVWAAVRDCHTALGTHLDPLVRAGGLHWGTGPDEVEVEILVARVEDDDLLALGCAALRWVFPAELGHEELDPLSRAVAAAVLADAPP